MAPVLDTVGTTGGKAELIVRQGSNNRWARRAMQGTDMDNM